MWYERQRRMLDEMGLRLPPQSAAAQALAEVEVEAEVQSEPETVAAPVVVVPRDSARGVESMDWPALREAVAACGRAVVLHEGSLSAGFGAELVATIQEEAFWSLHAPIGRVAAYDTPYPPGTVEELYVPSVDRVLAAVRAALEA